MAEDERAEGAGQVADGKGAVGQQGPDEGVVGGEVELVEDDARHDTVEEKVVPFDGGAQQAGQGHGTDLFLGGRVHACS